MPSDATQSHNKQDSINTQHNLHARHKLPFAYLLSALRIFFIALVLFCPKVYLANNIYYISKEIANLQVSRDILEEQNKQLKREREDIEFAFRVLNVTN
ncbi:hypothetical protein [Helicobacter sp. 23-1046]